MEGPSSKKSTARLDRPDDWSALIEVPSITLVGLEGPHAGESWDLALDTVRIGSATGNDVVLADDAVSGHHARIRRRPEGLLLEDCDSTNGVFVGGVRTTGAYLEAGQEIRIGRSTFRVQSGVRRRMAVETTQDRLGDLVGSGSAMRRVFGLIEAVARSPTTILIEGESGTGKEVVARTLHERSGRTGPLVTFDCASTSPELIQSELFGHVKGAFTGADRDHRGAFARAEGGTLFIDEIPALPLSLQPNLLRVLESREVQPLGSERTTPVDVRVVCATNEDLAARVQAGTFRLDLFHRIRVVPITLPPLRQRVEDLPALLAHLAERLEISPSWTPESLEVLATRPWPGNIRELRNLVERAGLLFGSRPIQVTDLEVLLDPVSGSPEGFGAAPVVAPPSSTPAPSPPAGDSPDPLQGSIEDIERRAIIRALEETAGNRTRAAELLGLSRATLKRRLRQYGMVGWQPGDPTP